jgi:hypothetical protein
VDEALNLALAHRHQTQSGKWNFLLILGVCLGGYRLYQAYLEQNVLKKENEKKETQKKETKNQQTEIDQKLIVDDANQQQTNKEDAKQIPKDHPTLNEILQKMSELRKLIELQRSNFGTEIQSLKTLLLGHEKFAAPPKIPEWQMPVAKEIPKKELVASEPSSKPETKGKRNKADKDKVKETKPSSSNNSIIEPTVLTGSNPE